MMAPLGSTRTRPRQPSQEWDWMRLPMELRILVWNFTLPTRQMHILRSEMRQDEVFVEIYIPLPVALQVCRESRGALLKRLTAIPRTGLLEDKRMVYCDMSTDSLFLDYSISSIALSLDVVPEEWRRFKRLCVPPLDGDRQHLEETKHRLTREVGTLARIFTSSAEILLAKFLSPDNKLIPRTSGRIPKCPGSRHRLTLACVGETVENLFPDQMTQTQDNTNLLSIDEEHQLWVSHLKEHSQGAPTQVRFAVVKISCKRACL
ncbi:hypothetical protein LX32DRAFT_576697 [Colletotrichum zoysiae]|uniref:2EXR domain-containing protein n=1 Tax=Colletotrichum zoysiae TaxID=1216348 RepID=A0AAD9H321_9PEZI|nr:hypothetical protein LX32DRAFT_576697 [Colletotrichum zoysiae]